MPGGVFTLSMRLCSGQVNMVMLNIDNPTWAEEVEEFGVDGLPHFSFLDRYSIACYHTLQYADLDTLQ